MQEDQKSVLKKVLIITYYWPPAGGPGVQRWLKFAKYLPKYGFQTVIYAPENPTYPIIDKELEKEVSKETIVIKQKIKEPYGLAAIFSKKKAKNMSSGIISKESKQTFVEKALLWIRGNMFIPDARVGWVKPSVSFLEKYIKENEVDCVITTGPPHSLHLIGMKLKELVPIKWIADFRDPWTTIGYHKELKLIKRSAKKHIHLEHSVLNSADCIVVTSESTKKEFSTKTSKPIEVITNGYDVEFVDKQPLDKSFSLAHIGSFLSNRNPRALWSAISELREENSQFKENFQLKLIGKVSHEVLETISEYKLDECTINMGYLSHKETLIQQRISQVLLLVEIDSEITKAIVPGKLFEYMAAERPILGIGPKDADFFKIIKQTNTGIVACYDEKERIKEILMEYFKKYQTGELNIHGMGLQYFSRKKLTEKLVKLLNKEELN